MIVSTHLFWGMGEEVLERAYLSTYLVGGGLRIFYIIIIIEHGSSQLLLDF